MFSHIMVGSNDIERARKFYDAIFAAIGAGPATTDTKGRLVYRHKGNVFEVTKPIDGQPATHANGGTIGFTMDSVEQGEAWHAAGVAHGGKSVEDPPGIRYRASGSVFLAYLRDPDGNKLCAVHRAKA